MADPNTKFAGSIPAFYDRHLGPVIFEPYAEDLARRLAAVVERGNLLEIACGTGILTRQLSRALAGRVQITATDLNEPMLDYARIKLALPQIEWRQADAMHLPFPDAAFDAIACQFGLMFMPDKAHALAEARRVLAPGGVLAFNVWGSFEQNPYASIANDAINSFFPDNPQTFYEIPFSLHDAALLQTLFDDAGFVDIQIESLSLPLTSVSAESFALGLVCGNPVSAAIQQRGGSIERITAAVQAALVATCGDKPVRSQMQVLVIMARAGDAMS